MTIRIDPERNEVRALRAAAAWKGWRVLEIGCGDGRLSLRLAGLGARVEGIDTNAELVRKARGSLPGRFAGRVRYGVARGEDLRFPDETFDVALFSWSL